MRTTGDCSLLGSRDAVSLCQALRTGELNCVDVAEAFLVASEGDELAAWSSIDGEVLLANAQALDRIGRVERDDLSLFGLPVGVKDNFDTVALPTAYGSPIYAGHRPRDDAEAVRRLAGAGALVAGKTKCTEFAWMSAADTLNPLDRSRTPGGSSSGSASAVAAGTVPIALGTQTAGSINRPASYCGVVGYKPTFDSFPRGGVKLLSWTLDTVGLLARSVRDVRLVAGVLAGPSGRASEHPGHELDRPPRLALARTSAWTEVQPAAQAAIEDVALAAWDAGACLEDLELPRGFAELVAAQEVIQAFESAESLAEELATHGELLSDALRAALEAGAAIAPDTYATAKRAAAELGPAIGALLAGYDGVLTPSTTGTPPLGLEFTGDPRFCRGWTLVGGPCVSVPVAWTPSRLPVGVQVVGAPFADARTLATADWLQEQLAPMTRNRV
ncbi:MAG TPA: amidase [Solirubrobacteraceae bacterium]|nr:amidase [Solirubrobacteraceae bacterium]